MNRAPPSTPWRPPEALLLASASATRRLLLESARLPVETCVSGVDERAVEVGCLGLPAAELAMRLAAAKAEAVASRFPGRIVIGADQVLECEGVVFHKPTDADAAREQIARLSGRTHALHSAIAIAQAGAPSEVFVEAARLTMRALDAEAVAAYVDLAGAAQVTASVGGYQLEDVGIHLFAQVEGAHATVLGLPLLPLLERLRARGLLAL